MSDNDPPTTESPGPAAEDPLVQDALAWLVHLHSGQETAKDWEDFQDWKNYDPAHYAAAETAERLWEKLGSALLQNPKHKRPGLAVIFIAGLVATGATFLAGAFGPLESFFADYRSGVGQFRSVTLADGSQVDLDTATSFDAESNGRTIKLYSGQIYVSVKPNPDQRFVVVVGNTRVTALGTAFAVRRDGSTGSVVVTEHAVQVATSDNGKASGAEVSADHIVSFSRDAGVGEPRQVDAKKLTSWRTGELVFNGLPLREVISEIERYRRGRILILNSAIGRFPVTGNFDLSDTDAFLASLELALPLRIIRLPGLVLISGI